MSRAALVALLLRMGCAGHERDEPQRTPETPADGWFTVDERAELLGLLARAGNGPVLVDVGASWCMPCVDLRRTFADARVKAAVAGYTAIELDVTAQSKEQLQLMAALGAEALPLVVRYDDASALHRALEGEAVAPPPSLVLRTFVAPDELLAALAR